LLAIVQLNPYTFNADPVLEVGVKGYYKRTVNMRRARGLILFCVLFTAFHGILAAQSELEILTEKARDGDIASMLSLGRMYYKGEEAGKDPEKAFRWFRKAARKDDPEAQTWVGFMYERGLGTRQNERRAFSYYEKAADQGYVTAQRNLAVLYETGFGVDKDPEKALRWYREAAGNGDVVSAKTLGKRYLEGTGVKKDVQEAMKWYLIAAEKGDAYSEAVYGHFCGQDSYPFTQNYGYARAWLERSAGRSHPLGLFFLGRMYERGEGIEEDADKATELMKKAVPGLKQLSSEGDNLAQYALGVIYVKGEAADRDIDKGLKLLKRSAEKGNVFARYTLGKLYYDDEYGIEKDLERSFEWHMAAAGRGYAPAEKTVGYMYGSGKGIKKNYKKMLEFTRRAAEKGHARAQSNLGFYYMQGKGVKKDQEKAVEWYRRSAEQNSGIGMSNLGYCYVAGQGVEKDMDKAIDLYRRAVAEGNRLALYNLGLQYKKGEGVPQNKAKTVEYYHISLLKGREAVRDNLEELDSKTGLYIPVVIKVDDEEAVLSKEKVENDAHEAVKAYAAGLADISRDLYDKALSRGPLALYGDHMWYNFHQNKVPMSWVSEYLLALYPEKEEDIAFWCEYAHCANLAGQPALALKAVRNIRGLIGTLQKTDHKDLFRRFASITESNALMQMGKSEQAYNILFEAGRFDQNKEEFTNYISHWARPLLKDRKKLSFVTGVKEDGWTGKFSLPVSQDFHDIETGKLIKGIGAAPEIDPGSGKKAKSEKADAGGAGEPKVTILE
jgi:TPR repeat protein